MKKILCIGDSLALPGHLNLYEDTWYYKLKQNLQGFDFTSYFKRMLTTNVLVTMGGGIEGPDKFPKGADCLECFMPDVVILQLGIVDCSPRLLFKYEKKIVNRLPRSLRNKYINLIKKFRKRSLSRIMIPISKFRNNIETYLERCVNNNVNQVIIIPIGVPDQRIIDRNPLINDSIKLFNDFYFQCQDYYNNVQVVQGLKPATRFSNLYQDGYHLNSKGHDVLVQQLINSIELDV